MSRYAVRKCVSIISYICLHVSKGASDYILVLNHKDQEFSYDDFYSSWSALADAEFVRQLFPGAARTGAVLAARISKLIVHLSKKARPGSVVTPAEPGLSGRSLLTDAQNVVLRGTPKPVPDKLKTPGKRAGKGSKACDAKAVEETTPETASSKLVKKFFVSTPGSSSLRQDECDALFEEHRSMYGRCYCFGMEEKHSIDVMKIVREAPAEYRVRSLEQRGIDTVYNRLSASPVIQKQTLCLMPVGCTSMPSRWEDIKDCEFYAINGQHTAAAARRMLEDPLCNRKNEVRQWDALIVWSTDALDLQGISNYYNLVNKINPFKATWGNNLIHARQTWIAMGKPKQVRNNSKGPLEQSVKWKVSTFNILCCALYFKVATLKG